MYSRRFIALPQNRQWMQPHKSGLDPGKIMYPAAVCTENLNPEVVVDA
jgi:hypothetical protein